jgi:phenylalanyl-tRNA synthetase beta chain
MQLSYNWLKDLVPDLQATPQEVAETLTMHMAETVVVKDIRLDPAVRAVKVTAIEKHPNADRLRLATVTDGQQEIKVVCGASNFAVGDIVPYSPPGATVIDEEGKPFVVKETTIRGVTSPGMLNSPRELGLGDWHSGLWILPPDTPLGESLATLLPPDTIVEADITPNRAHDCLSYYGIAQELAALLKLTVKPLTLSDITIPSGQGEWTITIEDATHTPRYLGAALHELTVKPAPLWMQARVLMSGTRPVNNLVDITNYVMYETGNPVHLFDAEQLGSKNIGIRFARSGEKLHDLDEVERELSDDTLVITSNDEPVALAGIMGGLKTGVTNATTQGFLEAANFAPYTIQKAATRLGLRTEAAARFLKGIAPIQAETALRRALVLLAEYAGAKVVQTLDMYPQPKSTALVSFRPAQASVVAGMPITSEQAEDALQRLRFKIQPDSAELWHVTAPAERLDIEGEHDVVEEVIRIFGLYQIPATPLKKNEKAELPLVTQIRNQTREMLVESGMIEVYNYSFENDLIAEAFGLVNETALELSNPVAPEQKHLRQSLLPRLLENLVTNKAEVRKKSSPYSKTLFEIGTVFRKGDGGIVAGVVEEEHLTGVSVDRSVEVLKENIQTLLSTLKPKGKIEFRELAGDDRWDKGSYHILLNDQVVGVVGIVARKTLLKLYDKFRLPTGIGAFELPLKALL